MSEVGRDPKWRRHRVGEEAKARKSEASVRGRVRGWKIQDIWVFTSTSSRRLFRFEISEPANQARSMRFEYRPITRANCEARCQVGRPSHFAQNETGCLSKPYHLFQGASIERYHPRPPRKNARTRNQTFPNRQPHCFFPPTSN